MKKTRRILAIIGIILLVGMYLATLIAAIFDSSETMTYFKGCIGLTIVVPVLIWIYTLFYKLITGHRDDNYEASTGSDEKKDDLK